MKIEALVFDIGGVLEIAPSSMTPGEPTHAFDELLVRWERAMDLGPGELAARLRRMSGDGETGTCTIEQWEKELKTVVGVREKDHASFIDDFWDVYLGALNEPLAKWIREKRATHRIAFLSNSFVGAREREEARYRFSELAELIVYSHEEGMKKPDPRIYRATCERLGLQPGETVFIDDVPGHVRAAEEVGMRGVVFTDNESAIAAIQRWCA